MMIRSNLIILIVGSIAVGLCATLHAGSRGVNLSRPSSNQRTRISTPGQNSYISAGRGGGAGGLSRRAASASGGGILRSAASRTPIRSSMGHGGSGQVTNRYGSIHGRMTSSSAPSSGGARKTSHLDKFSANRSTMTKFIGKTANDTSLKHSAPKSARRNPGTKYSAGEHPTATRSLPTLTSEGALNRPGMLPSAEDAVAEGRGDGLAISVNSYLYAVQSETLRKQTDKEEQEISSLAPEKEGTLRRLMVEGEKNFRQGRYGQAARDFRRAATIYPNSPEVMLSLFHTHLAGSAGSRFYKLSAHRLGQALRRLPELPLIPVHPKKFYQDTSLYIRDRQAVERRTRDAADDGDAWLILGYLAWRDGKVSNAHRALRHAITHGSENTIESASILWDGILATGKAEGQLIPIEKEQSTPAEIPSTDPDPSTKPTSPGPS
jgi:hypothetical protein